MVVNEGNAFSLSTADLDKYGLQWFYVYNFDDNIFFHEMYIRGMSKVDQAYSSIISRFDGQQITMKSLKNIKYSLLI